MRRGVESKFFLDDIDEKIGWHQRCFPQIAGHYRQRRLLQLVPAGPGELVGDIVLFPVECAGTRHPHVEYERIRQRTASPMVDDQLVAGQEQCPAIDEIKL